VVLDQPPTNGQYDLERCILSEEDVHVAIDEEHDKHRYEGCHHEEEELDSPLTETFPVGEEKFIFELIFWGCLLTLKKLLPRRSLVPLGSQVHILVRDVKRIPNVFTSLLLDHSLAPFLEPLQSLSV
jgi:hypothetical protein